jgi:hypothetical protein
MTQEGATATHKGAITDASPTRTQASSPIRTMNRPLPRYADGSVLGLFAKDVGEL